MSESDYYPYGGEIPVITGDTNRYKFTGKERDSETGLDNFGARYYGSNFGRFMTPDWAARPITVPYAVFGDPQSLNLYGYVRNDPVSQVDADGHGSCQAPGIVVNPSTILCEIFGGHRGLSAQAKPGAAKPCKADFCTTATANKRKSVWGEVGSWFSGTGIAFIRWGRLGGPAHRAAVRALSERWEAEGYKVTNEKFIRTPGGAKSSRFADVYGTKINPDGTESTRIGQIGRTNANGIPVSREQSALNDIQQAVPDASVEFYDYQAPFPSEGGTQGWPVADVPAEIRDEPPVDPEIF